VARNPYQPGVGTSPPYLAGREPQLRRFERILGDYPEKRRNLRITGLRGVGKTVLLKELERIAKADRERKWVVVRRDFVPRMKREPDFVHRVAETLKAISEVQVEIADGVTMTMGPGAASPRHRILEDRLRAALIELGELAAATGRGVIFMFDEAHEVYDQPRKGEYPLSALLSAIVAAQDRDEPPLPLMLVLCGLPSLAGHLRDARSHAERLFRSEELSNLPLEPTADGVSQAELALTRPVEDEAISYAPGAAARIVRDVDGYPYFIQWYGEALWDVADEADRAVIDDDLYAGIKRLVQRGLDEEFYEGRYGDARAADQRTLRAAASLGDERFAVADLNRVLASRSANANAQSLKRLVDGNIVYRVSQGVYGYTAPLFGDFLRREHPYGTGDG